MIIHIRFSEDLPTRAQNKLRFRMEMAAWLAKWRELRKRVAANPDDILASNALDDHSNKYDKVGLP